MWFYNEPFKNWFGSYYKGPWISEYGFRMFVFYAILASDKYFGSKVRVNLK